MQLTANAADATIYGFEADAAYSFDSNLSVSMNVGYLHGKYDRLRRALAAGNVITPDQLLFKIPYLSPWFYGAAIDYRVDVGSDELAFRASFNHVDTAFSNDINTGIVNAINNIDASVSWKTFDNKLTLALYGQNLLENVVNGLEFQLAYEPNLSVSPITRRGRVFGLKAQYAY